MWIFKMSKVKLKDKKTFFSGMFIFAFQSPLTLDCMNNVSGGVKRQKLREDRHFRFPPRSFSLVF